MKISGATLKGSLRLSQAVSVPSGPQMAYAFTYTGTGAARTFNNLLVKPDLVFLKDRFSTTRGWRVGDAQQFAQSGIGYFTFSTNGWQLNSTAFQGFGADSFSYGNDPTVNANGASEIAFIFQKLAGAFTTAEYTGNGSAQTLAHNLGAVPEMMWVRRTDSSGNWSVYHPAIGLTKAAIFLNSSAAQLTANNTTFWNGTAPTATHYTIGTNTNVTTSGADFNVYLFASKPGVCKIGSYVGNGGAEGPAITTDFKGRVAMIKAVNAAGDWMLFDNARDTTSPHQIYSQMNGTTSLEENEYLDATGVKMEDTLFQAVDPSASAGLNTNGITYLYAVWA